MTPQPPAGAKPDLGTIMNRVIETYSKTAGVLIPGALVVFVPVALLAAMVAGSAAASLLVALVSVMASVWYAGMVARTVPHPRAGRCRCSTAPCAPA